MTCALNVSANVDAYDRGHSECDFDARVGDYWGSIRPRIPNAVFGPGGRGAKIAGVIAEPAAPWIALYCGRAAGIESGEIYQVLSRDAPTSCDIDAAGVESAGNSVLRDLSTSDLVALSKFVSAFPITYAARLDAATKLHGISSSIRL